MESPARARQRLAGRGARGELLCCIDDDDCIAGKLDSLLPLMQQRDARRDVAYGNTAMLGPEANDLGTCRSPADLPTLCTSATSCCRKTALLALHQRKPVDAARYA